MSKFNEGDTVRLATYDGRPGNFEKLFRDRGVTIGDVGTFVTYYSITPTGTPYARVKFGDTVIAGFHDTFYEPAHKFEIGDRVVWLGKQDPSHVKAFVPIGTEGTVKDVSAAERYNVLFDRNNYCSTTLQGGLSPECLAPVNAEIAVGVSDVIDYPEADRIPVHAVVIDFESEVFRKTKGGKFRSFNGTKYDADMLIYPVAVLALETTIA